MLPPSPEAPTPNKRYRFGPFLLDVADQLLLRDGVPISVPPKVYEVLLYFVERPGRLVRREDLHAGVWQGVYVADQALTQMLRKVRVALGDEVDEPRYLQTVYGRGYRFVASVAVETDHVEGVSAERGPGEGGPLIPSSAVASGVPRARDRHFGHSVELARLQEIYDGGARLIFLVGAPGVGKSRLAAEFAAALAGQANGGAMRTAVPVEWVDLADVCDDPGLLAAIHEGLGGELSGATPLSTRLVVLDQTDGITEPLAARIGFWMLAAPDTCFLCTGREALRVAGESVCPVRPLPTADAQGSDVPVSTAQLRASPAVVLFEDRARAVLPEYAVNEGDVASVAALVTALDGLPLAIELAAARVRSLPPKALLDRLEHRFDLLESPRRDLPERHRSLRAAITVSWNALPPWGRAALVALSKLDAAWTLELGEATLGPSARGVPPPCAIIDALFGRSLLRATPGPRGVEYRLLECVRAYARDRAASPDSGGA